MASQHLLPLPERQPLARRLEQLLDSVPGSEVCLEAAALDTRDEMHTLQLIYDLHLAPLSRIGSRADWQHHPAVATVKGELEARFLSDLDRRSSFDPEAFDGDAVAAIRALTARDLVPPIYEWLAEEAGPEEIRAFLSLEGGPDAGFDDLVAVAQVGLAGEPKLELARNYWDEMGRGLSGDVHTNLHTSCVRALGLSAVPVAEQPLAGLRRTVLTGMLATNRRLQPELVGALGTIELQAGPRCRKVVRALERVGADEDALGFYREHAVADPRHGKDWLDNAIRPLAADPEWARRMVTGAAYRCQINLEFFQAVAPLVLNQDRAA